MSIVPCQTTSGISFFRTDVKGPGWVPAVIENVVDTTRATTLANKEGVIVQSVEHVLSVLWGMGVDNAVIMLDNIEPPAMDGSTQEIADRLGNDGLETMEAEREYLEIAPGASYGLDYRDCWVTLGEASTALYTYYLDYPSPLNKQVFTALESAYWGDICRARTFASLEDVVKQKSMGLSRGSHAGNALFHSEGEWIYAPALHWSNEPCRHKVLDLIGDMALLGVRVKGHVVSNKGGHTIHTDLVRILRKAYHESIKQP
jgi:UDP-3-O-acyl-N-acetylglucosamine deacetylase